MDTAETHEKIINVLREKGPSLPINIAKALETSSLFISAFLSELTNQNRIKVSNLKVGGSPLYFMEGQEAKLEDYYKYLHPRESEAFLLLKEHKVLRDSDQDPATRVALRSIKDFSVGFKMGEEIYWRFVSVPSQEVDGILNGGNEKVVEKETFANSQVSSTSPHPPTRPEESVDENSKEVVVNKEVKNEFDNPLIVKEVKRKKEKPRSDFVQRVIGFIKGKGLEIVEERRYKAKEYNCIVRVRSELGPISFLTQAKDKKTITEGDFKKLLSSAQSIPLPAFMLYTGEISKKAKDYLRDYGSVLKAKRIS